MGFFVDIRSYSYVVEQQNSTAKYTENNRQIP